MGVTNLIILLKKTYYYDVVFKIGCFVKRKEKAIQSWCKLLR